MGIFDFLQQPDVTLVQALLLKFKPANMDVLPLYIVLLAAFPPMLWLLLRAPVFALAGSFLLYALTWHFQWALPAYPNGTWVFNPFAWQLLFVFGAWCALGGAERLSFVIMSPITAVLAVLFLVFAFLVALTWYVPGLDTMIPKSLEEWMYIDKTNLHMFRFVHFLCLAVVTVRLVPVHSAGIAVRLAASRHPVRPKLPRNLLPRRVPLLRGAFRPGGSQRGRRYAGGREHFGPCDNDRDSRPVVMVQAY